jgi:hypothetical protein
MSREIDWTKPDKDLRAGMFDCDVARKYGINRVTVMIHRQRILNLPSPNPSGKGAKDKTKYDWTEVDKELRAGRRNEYLSKKYGIPESTIRGHKQHLGIAERFIEPEKRIHGTMPFYAIRRRYLEMKLKRLRPEHIAAIMNNPGPFNAVGQWAREARG